MSVAPPEVTVETAADEEFAELDDLEVIETSELKVGGAYHSYTYIAANNEEDVSV
ncbi:hypothetical protein [Embleya hyalina]|uniref:Uncharacterized protein n=1 Tax=Embleya hyalina TaxID=516124 RepID=A0A401YDT0_9ACTN|nr:hypothetical protein [Embleya hyalina]GCD92757.1 hypothetical protein EHYA_00398 [Embleya hyalina]